MYIYMYIYIYIYIYITWGGDSKRASAAAWSTAVTRNAPVWFSHTCSRPQGFRNSGMYGEIMTITSLV